MNIRKIFKTVPLVAGLCAAGLLSSQSAQAYTYAGSKLDISNLTIGLNGAPQDPANLTIISSFTFTTLTNATINGVSDTSAGRNPECGGTNPSGTPGGLVSNCGAAPTLASNAANAPGGATLRANGDYSLSGNTAVNYANAGAAILSAQLTDGVPTSLTSVSEANVIGNGNVAQASTLVTSNTTFGFIIQGVSGTVVTITFNASLSQLGEINNAPKDAISAKAEYGSSVVVGASGDWGSARWSPDGTLLGCGLNCTEISDASTVKSTNGTLTDDALAASHSTSAGRIAGIPFGDPSFVSNSLTDGLYQLQFTLDCGANVICNGNIDLTAGTSVLVTQQIPAPATLGLLGLGLLTLGSMRRRKASAV